MSWTLLTQTVQTTEVIACEIRPNYSCSSTFSYMAVVLDLHFPLKCYFYQAMKMESKTLFA